MACAVVAVQARKPVAVSGVLSGGSAGSVPKFGLSACTCDGSVVDFCG